MKTASVLSKITQAAMFTIALDFGSWKGVKFEKGKNLVVQHIGWMSIWCFNMSLLELINKLRNQPVKSKDKNNKHLLN